MMILDTLNGTLLKGHLGPRFTSARDWIAQVSPDAPNGRVDLERDEVFALRTVRLTFTTASASAATASHHKQELEDADTFYFGEAWRL